MIPCESGVPKLRRAIRSVLGAPVFLERLVAYTPFNFALDSPDAPLELIVRVDRVVAVLARTSGLTGFDYRLCISNDECSTAAHVSVQVDRLVALAAGSKTGRMFESSAEITLSTVRKPGMLVMRVNSWADPCRVQ